MTNGHGWVTPLPDGARARCGGPGLCASCQQEAADRLRDMMHELVTRPIDASGPELTLANWLAFKRKLTLASDPRRN